MKFDPKVPASLLDLQKWFVKIESRIIRRTGEFKIPLYDRKTALAIEKRITAGPKLSAAERLGIYNQQYWWRLFALMQDRYPGLTRLFGAADFNRSIAEPYLLKYYPNDWSMNALSSRLPRWIEEEYREEDKILVLQMALADESHQRLPQAPQMPPLKPGEERKRLYLQPFVALLDLDADLFSFRAQLIEREPKHWEENDFPPLDWSEKKRRFALYRGKEELQYEEISDSESILLKAFEKGSTLSLACSLLGEAPQIGAWFQKWTARGWLTTAPPKS